MQLGDPGRPHWVQPLKLRGVPSSHPLLLPMGALRTVDPQGESAGLHLNCIKTLQGFGSGPAPWEPQD